VTAARSRIVSSAGKEVGEVLGPVRPLLYADGELYGGYGYRLLRSSDGGESFEHLATGERSALDRIAARMPLFSRVTRSGIHSLVRLSDGRFVAVMRNWIGVLQPGDDRLRSVFRFPRGSRPLRLCRTRDDQLYFGEYFRNPSRKAVHIYTSRDGQDWHPIFTFPAGSIRHVHAMYEDIYRSGLWVLTGDADDESGLWFTKDEFATLEPVMRGSQRSRAVSMIIMEDGIIVPTDSPRITNRIQFFDPSRRRFEDLCSIPGSAFHAVTCGGLFFVSTVAEPSPINPERAAHIFISRDGRSWIPLTSFSPDLLCRMFPSMRAYFQYPEIRLVPGVEDSPVTFAYGQSIRGAGGSLMRFQNSLLVQNLRE